jgi:chromosome segregation ATPase
MAQNQMHWLREHMRSHLDEVPPAVDDKVLSFRHATASVPQRQDADAVDLVYQAADVVRSVQDRAAQIEARAEDLVKRAIDKLQIAEERIRALELGEQQTRRELAEACSRADAAEKAAARAQARAAALETQSAAAAERARTAEARAGEAEKALRRIEHAIRTQILENGRASPRKPAVA